jgi:CheY-like chemotaxis protein
MPAEKGKSILLVEDENIIALMEERKIRHFGYEVIVANSGEKAIELATKDQEIALVLMDINLGAGIDGTEAARRILGERNIPIVFLTSHSEKEYVDSAKKITPYGYVLKNSSDFVLQSSIDIAFELFEANENIRIEREKLQESKDTAERYLNIIATLLGSRVAIYRHPLQRQTHRSWCRGIGKLSR